jgi:CHAT domain-containing protein
MKKKQLRHKAKARESSAHETKGNRFLDIFLTLIIALPSLTWAIEAIALDGHTATKTTGIEAEDKTLEAVEINRNYLTASDKLQSSANPDPILTDLLANADYQQYNNIYLPTNEGLVSNKKASSTRPIENDANDILKLLEKSRILRESGKLGEALETLDVAKKIVDQLEVDALVKGFLELPLYMSRYNVLTMLERHDEALQSINRVLRYIEIESVSSMIKKDSGFLGKAPYSAYYKAALASKYNDIKKAPKLLKKGIDLLESSTFKNQAESESIYLEYADFFVRLGHRQQAIEIYSMLGERYIKNAEMSESPQYASILSSLADLYMIEGNFGLAELLLQGAVAIYAKNQDMHPYEYQWVKVSLSKLQNNIGEALLISEKIEKTAYNNDNREQVLRAVSSQLVFAHRLGNTSKLTQVFKRLSNLPKKYFSERIIASHAEDYVIILTALSEHYLSAGSIGEARETLDSAIGLSLRELGTGNFLSLKALMVLARTDEYLDSKRARAMYSQIAEISYEHGLLIQAIDSLSRLSFLEFQNGNIEQAVRQGIAHSKVYLEFLIDTLPTLTREDRVNTISFYDSNILHSLSSFHRPAIEGGLWAAINERGLLNHIEIQQKRSAQEGKQQKLARKISELSISNITSRTNGGLGNRQEMRSAQLLLNQMTPYKPTNRFFTINDLLNVLPEGSTYIHVVRYLKYSSKGNNDPFDYYGAYVSSRAGNVFVDIGPASDIDGIIVEARHSVASNLSDSRQKLYKVYQQAVAPWIREVRHKSNIYLSLDSEMNVIPIESLYVDGFGERVLSDLYKINLVSSPRDYVQGFFEKVPARSGKPVVFANPAYAINANVNAYNQRSDQLKIMPGRSRSWEPLQYAGAEGRLVSSTINSKLFEKEGASEKNVKEVKSPLVLHLAAHAFFDPIKNNKVLTADPSTRSLNAYENIEHYLYGSGIALATPVSGGDYYSDGILSAAEASRLELVGTELVVLSACSTGDGVSTSGLGVFGLHRSFIEAGAKSVLTSLWKVDDQSTAEFMNRFYILIKEGKSKNEALRMVKKDFREGRVGNGQWKEPYYWAAWQLVGDWRPVKGL